MRTLGPLPPSCPSEGGRFVEGDSPFSEAGTYGWEGRRVSEPSQEVWRGLWACRALRHWETFEAEAATWAGWGDEPHIIPTV